MIQLPQVEAEAVKSRLGNILVETVEAIRAGSGPLADRLTQEYFHRSLIGSISYGLAFIIALILTIICRRNVTKVTNTDDQGGWIFCCVVGTILICVFLYQLTCHAMDAASPVYSLIKELLEK